ncbi:MAG: DUF4392 domain-containing protein [Clostridiaceae bacterium]|nr:DUF4392 domain-containing protein [Clostridiaceae bacterium]
MNISYYTQLEDIIRRNLERRGLSGVERTGELKGAAESLLSGKTVLIVTGFAVRSAMKGETDGPLGTVSLAEALERLGKKVIIVTDGYSEDIMHSGLKALGLRCPVEVVPVRNESLFCRDLLEKYKPTHIAAIERPGRAADGRCYSMKGEDISDIVPNTDILFDEAKDRGITTIGVGDGGNEIGMGSIRSYIMKSVYKGERISAVAGADFLILAGVSNWGGHALSAALSILSRLMLLHDTETEKRLLESIVASGAVDGSTAQRTISVDGLSLDYNLEILDLLRGIIEEALEKQRD